MKRDMELVRSILLHLDEMPEPTTHGVPEVGGYDQITVGHHLRLLDQAGLVDAKNAQVFNDVFVPAVLSLTWRGHEFLDDVRDPDVWAKTKVGAEKVGSWALSTVAEIAKGYIKAKVAGLGLHMG